MIHNCVGVNLNLLGGFSTAVTVTTSITVLALGTAVLAFGRAFACTLAASAAGLSITDSSVQHSQGASTAAAASAIVVHLKECNLFHDTAITVTVSIT